MEIKIALEWFMNPDHLPMIAGIATGKYQEAGLDVQLIQPEDHYDGFEELKSGKIDIHCNEPLHLYEHYFDGLKSLGCFFETRGGVMMRSSSIEKLRTNEKIRITTPASNPTTNRIGYEILRRYAEKNGFMIDQDNVEFVENDFWHISNMKKDETLDGAWLCFYNFEGVEAQAEGFENLFIDQFEASYPNFSALEFMTVESTLEKKGEALSKFIDVTNDMVAYINANPNEAARIYYDFTKEEKSTLMDKIILDTLPRFDKKIAANNKRWQELRTFLEDLDVVKLSEDQYESIWSALETATA